MAVQLEIIVEDLSFLYTAKMAWDSGWSNQSDRFEAVKGEDINWSLGTAYWLPDWNSVMVFRTYLSSINAEFQILLDNAEGIDPYVILCNLEF